MEIFGFVVKAAIILWLLLMFITCIVVIYTFVYLFIEVAIHNRYNKKSNINLSLSTWIKMCVLECCYVCSKYILFPRNFWPITYYGSETNNSDTGIVLVHGYSRRKTDWLFFAKKLTQHTKLPITAINLGNTAAPIQVLAEKLEQKLQHAQIDLQVKKWILVGHSMGGVVSCYFSEYINQEIVSKVITIGSPLKGTKLAYAGFGESTRQIEPSSVFLDNLQQAMTKSNVKYYHVATKLDNLIMPWQSCILNNHKGKIVLDSTTHQQLLYNEKVISSIAIWLQGLQPKDV